MATGLDFAQESLRKAWYEVFPLAQANARETGASEFNPDRDKLLALEESGTLHFYTARLDGRLKGYAIFCITPHLHYHGLWALQDALYVDPSSRGIGSVRFMRWTERMLKTAGADKLIRHVNAKLDYSRTLLRMGYTPLETSYVKEL